MSETAIRTVDADGNDRIGDWIQLISGRPFWPLDPHLSDIHIGDIAWALSMQCRYAGHVKRFYSVAEHSVLVSCTVPPEHALWGLLHDATEAYLVDLPRPIKRCIPEYRVIEDRLAEHIAKRFDLCWPMPTEVKAADTAALHTERAALLAPSMKPWGIGQQASASERPGVATWVLGLSPEQAHLAFLDRFAALSRGDS